MNTVRFSVSVHSFLLFSMIPLYGCTTICLSTHLLVDVSVVSSFWRIESCSEHLCTSLCADVRAYSWFGVEWLDHMVAVFHFLRNCKLFANTIVQFYFSISSIGEFWFLHISASLWYGHLCNFRPSSRYLADIVSCTFYVLDIFVFL